jgi:hypothetical protein
MAITRVALYTVSYMSNQHQLVLVAYTAPLAPANPVYL